MSQLTCKNYSLGTTTQAGLVSLTVGIIYTNCETNSIPPGAVATLIENPVSEEDRERLRSVNDVVAQNVYLTEICSRTQPIIPNDPYGIAITEIGTCTEPPVTVTPTPTPTPTPNPNRCIVFTDCGNNGIDPIDNRSYICGSPFESVALSTGLQVYGTCTKLYGALYVANPAAAVTPDEYSRWFGELPLSNKLKLPTGQTLTSPLTNPTPSAGYEFVNWTPATETTDNNDVTFTANYKSITQLPTVVELTTEPQTGGGTISITSGELVGTPERSVTINAVPASTHNFTRFEVRDGSDDTLISASSTTPITVQVSRNRKVTAFFTQKVEPVVTIAPASAAVTVAQGSTVSNIINITRTNYTGDVSLEVDQLPPGVSVVSIVPNPNAFVITLSAVASATTGTTTVSCTARYGTNTATTVFQLTVTRVGTPTLSLRATDVTMRKSAVGRSTVTATTTELNDQERVTTVTVDAASLARATVSAPAITFTGTGQLTITTTAASVPGDYLLTLTGRTASGLIATTTLGLIIEEDTVQTRTVTYAKTPLAAGYTLPPNQTVNVNTSIQLPPASAAGYTFDGWFVGDQPRSGTQTITADTTFIARFTLVGGPPPSPSSTPQLSPTTSPILPAPSPSRTPLPSTTPIPSRIVITYRDCISGVLNEGLAPQGYREVAYAGAGGGTCWEPSTIVGFQPSLSEALTFTYQRGGSSFPQPKPITANNPSYGVSYRITMRTNPDIIVQPSSFTISPRSSQQFFVNVTPTLLDKLGDGTSTIEMSVDISEV
jgi:hypothetical protein